MPEPDNRRQVLFRMADTNQSTYMYWRWLDDPDNPAYQVLDSQTLARVEELLSAALVSGLEGESDEDAVRRALVDGPLATPARERDWSTALRDLVLPEQLSQEIIKRTEAGETLLVRILPSPRLARVPWELLPLPNRQRLIEAVTIRLDAPAVVNSNRGRNPQAWDEVKNQPPLYLLEPPTGAGTKAHVGRHVIAGAALDLLEDANMFPVHSPVTRAALGSILRGESSTVRDQLIPAYETPGPPSRILYYGHASSAAEEPGSAAIHLSDGGTTFGAAIELDGGHRPFTALDLLLGTAQASHRYPDTLYPHEKDLPGHEIWPIPPRAALIACESGADHRAVETFGLIIALLNAGAEIVTTTRWTLATDYAFQHITEATNHHPTTELAIAVDTAHQCEDPIAALRGWQLQQLHNWEATANIEYSPLTWAALTTHVSPAPQ
jgi:CHAT domain